MFAKFRNLVLVQNMCKCVVSFWAVLMMNIPILSYGMALGWVSLASGNETEDPWDAKVVVAATTTFLASLVTIPLMTKALLYGRKPTLIAASVLFALCWSLKLGAGASLGAMSVWGVVVGRAAAGVAGAAAWCAAPLMTAESVSSGASAVGSAASHNAGMLLMYIAAALRIDHNVVLWGCLGISTLHVFMMLLMPESPAYLAACDRTKEATKALAWLHCTSVDNPQLDQKLAALPPPEIMPTSLWSQSREMFKVRARRRAFFISCFAVIGQEVSGVLALLQYAERALTSEAGAADDGGAGRAVALGGVQLVAALLALPLLDRVGRRVRTLSYRNDELTDLRGGGGGRRGRGAGCGAGGRAAGGGVAGAAAAGSGWKEGKDIVIHNELTDLRGGAADDGGAGRPVALGGVQLVAALLALPLLDRVGRRPLLVSAAFVTALCLCAGAVAVRWSAGVATVALATAVASDAVGLQTVPYALIADMFHYQYRGCALTLATAAAALGNAAEVFIFPAAARAGGVVTSLACASASCLMYAIVVACVVPETRDRSLEEIYEEIAPSKKYNETVCTRI